MLRSYPAQVLGATLICKARVKHPATQSPLAHANRRMSPPHWLGSKGKSPHDDESECSAAPKAAPWQLKARLNLTASALEPTRSIGRISSPVLIAAGSDVQHTTLAESQELYDAASNPKALWIATGAKHQDLLNYDKAQYESHVVRFLIDNLRTTPQFDAQRLSKEEVDK